jgi:hypothetical protein
MPTCISAGIVAGEPPHVSSRGFRRWESLAITGPIAYSFWGLRSRRMNAPHTAVSPETHRQHLWAPGRRGISDNAH